MEATQPGGIEVGRDRVARLTGSVGLVGVRPSKFKRTTITDGTVHRPSDLADSQFAATGPNQRVEQGR
jgi:hypothetical protein